MPARRPGEKGKELRKEKIEREKHLWEYPAGRRSRIAVAKGLIPEF